MGIEGDGTARITPTVTLAKVYEEQGLLDKAADVYRKLVALEPQRRELREALRDVEARLQGQRPRTGTREAKTILSKYEKWQSAIDDRRKILHQDDRKERKILVIHGPGAGMIGEIPPPVPSDVSFEEIDKEITKTAEACNLLVETFQSDREDDLVRKIKGVLGGYDLLIINPAEYAHTSTAIRDALSMLDIPIIEVHLSNTCGQDPGRQKSLMAEVVTAHVAGFGKEGYMMAVRAAANMTDMRSMEDIAGGTRHRA